MDGNSQLNGKSMSSSVGMDGNSQLNMGKQLMFQTTNQCHVLMALDFKSTCREKAPRLRSIAPCFFPVENKLFILVGDIPTPLKNIYILPPKKMSQSFLWTCELDDIYIYFIFPGIHSHFSCWGLRMVFPQLLSRSSRSEELRVQWPYHRLGTIDPCPRWVLS